jgi:hypothetical protein
MAHVSDPNLAAARLEAEQHNSKQVADYLRRYLDLSEDERLDLIARFRELPPVSRALMESDAELGLKLEQFRSENRRETRAPFRDYAFLLAIAITGLLITLYGLAVVD